jgi:hypothetical protein
MIKHTEGRRRKKLMELKWALAIAFAGVTVLACADFYALSDVHKKKLGPWFILGLFLMWLGTIWQMTL